MTVYDVAVIAGDGIGREVIPHALQALKSAGEFSGEYELRVTQYPWSSDWYLTNGQMMPDDGLDQLEGSDAILLGSIGDPRVPDHISLWGLLLPIRQRFDQYVNLRPIRLLDGVRSPLRDRSAADIDFVCVRENTEGEYSGIGGRFGVGRSDETALQTSVFTRAGCERVVRYAFELASTRSGRLASATKSNALQYTAVLWDEVVRDVGAEFPQVAVTPYHVDALAARMILAPDTLDVVVASNLFGDILTDVGGALQGSLGLAAAGNIDPSRRHPSMFEPVHGSAPDIAGLGVANPIAALWAAAMMLSHLGAEASSELLMAAIATTAVDEVLTPDLGGTASTSQVANHVVEAMRDAAA